MELSDYGKWRIANLQVMLFLVTGAIISVIPSRDMWFGFISDRGVNVFISVASGFWIHLITKRLVTAFDEYQPKTSLQAKRANEQIKLTANFANAISTATIAVLALSQLVGDKRPEYYKIIIGITIAAMIHAGGRNLVSLLKDETLGSNP